MKYLPISIVALVAYSSAVSILDNEWHGFKQQYGKIYRNEIEEAFRRKIFTDNKQKINEHNEKFEKGLVSYKMGVNKYADLLHSELGQMMNGFKENVNNKQILGSQEHFVGSSNQDLPKEVDWRELGAVTRVKDQASSNYCTLSWAFSATGSLEAQYFLKTGKLVALSEQNLIDCSQKYGNGCHGGSVNGSFQYVIDNGGIATEKSYPYEGITGLCRYNTSNIGAMANSYVDLPSGDEDKLKEAVAKIGPISIRLYPTKKFLFYNSGIFYDPHCDKPFFKLDALIVGYGTDDETKQDYWLVKNSSGSDWGEDGYIRVARNRNNNCGIASQARYPVV